MNLRTLPKVELHRHLEGSIRLDTALDIAQRAGVALPASSRDALGRALQVLAPMDSLEQVLAIFGHIGRLFVDLPAVERLAHEAVIDAADDGIVLLELRFSPDYMASAAGLDWDGLTEAVRAGVASAQAERDIHVGLIGIVSRSLGVESARRTVAWAGRWRDALVGFDLADDEVGWPSHRFTEALAPIHELGLGLTVHTGEACGPAYVWDTLRSLRPRRLGHGVAVADDPALVAAVRDAGVAVEVCPTSNLRTRAVSSLERHPAKLLFDAGVGISINTDDPGLFALDLSGELAIARAQMGFSDAHLLAVQRAALRASFLSDEIKRDVEARHLGAASRVT